MRLWFALVLAFSVLLAPLGVAGSARAMDASGCAGKVGQSCPCKQAPKSCMEACAAATVEVGIFSGLILTASAVPPRFVHALTMPLSPDSIEQGLDPPVPRA